MRAAATLRLPTSWLRSEILIASAKTFEALGIAIAGTRFFGDHFRLRDSDWADCIREACARGAASVITTEKDAIKLTEDPGQELLVAVQSTHLEEQDEFERKLDAIFRRYW